jgi:hypothetical protein
MFPYPSEYIVMLLERTNIHSIVMSEHICDCFFYLIVSPFWWLDILGYGYIDSVTFKKNGILNNTVTTLEKGQTHEEFNIIFTR